MGKRCTYNKNMLISSVYLFIKAVEMLTASGIFKAPNCSDRTVPASFQHSGQQSRIALQSTAYVTYTIHICKVAQELQVREAGL